MSNNKTGIITMSRKAGKLVTGMDMVKEACYSKTAKAVFVADDFSVKSLKDVKYACYRGNVKLYSLGMNMDDLWYGLGKKVGVVAMTDSGFAKSCAKGLTEIEIDSNEFYSV